jgi:geranylgeranyl reductase family protein
MRSTLPLLDEAEIVVVGGGPAGAIAAFTLASAGHDVVIIDRQTFPRDKACGDGLTSSAVSFLRELGLEQALDGALRVEAARLCVDWKEREVSSMRTRWQGDWSEPCTVPRRRFDHALIRLACAAGTRLMQGHVNSPLREGGHVIGVELNQRGARGVVTGRHLLAADGATSRLRTEIVGRQPLRAASSYAVRTYAVTDEPLQPIFDIYVPVADSHAGYGWVFPVSERVANVGIGYVTARGLPRPRPITSLLDAFLAGLRRHRGPELGSLEVVGSGSGAPLGINFSAERCQQDGVIFAGDAARTCDPITGEGISQAMRGAHACALELHRAIRRRGSPVGIGDAIARSDLRAGQDSAMIARLGHELLRRRSPDQPDSTGIRGEPTSLFSVARAMLTAELDRPSLTETPAGDMATKLGCAGAMRALDERLRDQLRSKFILCSELVHREACAGTGPIGALMVFATHVACGKDPSEPVLDAALAVELLRVYPRVLGLVTPATDNQANANNAIAIMIGDYALSGATGAAAGIGASFSGMLGEAVEASSEGIALLARDPLWQGDPIRRYIERTRLTDGTSLALAARIGAGLASGRDALDSSLCIAGESMGMATRICEDLMALTLQDPVTGQEPWRALEESSFRLPVILAVEEDHRVASLLREKKERIEWESVLDVIRSGAGLRRASEICGRYAAEARELALESMGDGNPVTELFELPRRCLVPLGLASPVEPRSRSARRADALRLAS